jgi:hypothetical protein
METGSLHWQDNLSNAQMAGLTSKKFEKTVAVRRIVIRASLGNLDSFDDEGNWEAEEDRDACCAFGNLWDNYIHGWLMETIL